MKTNVITVIHGDSVKFIATDGKILKSMNTYDPDNYDTIVEIRKPIGKSFIFKDECTKQRYDNKEFIDMYDLRKTPFTYDDSGRSLNEIPEDDLPARVMMVDSAEIVDQRTCLDSRDREYIVYVWRYVLRECKIEKRYYRSKDRLYKKLKRQFGISLTLPERMEMRNVDIVKLVAKILGYRILNIVYV